MTYRVLTNSRRIEKAFLRIITGFGESEQDTIWVALSGNLTYLPAIAWNTRLSMQTMSSLSSLLAITMMPPHIYAGKSNFPFLLSIVNNNLSNIKHL